MRKPYYDGDAVNALIDAAYFGRISRRTFFRALIAAGFTAAAARDMAEQAAQAQANQAAQRANLKTNTTTSLSARARPAASWRIGCRRTDARASW